MISLCGAAIKGKPRDAGIYGSLGRTWIYTVELPSGTVRDLAVCESEMTINGLSVEDVLEYRIRMAMLEESGS